MLHRHLSDPSSMGNGCGLFQYQESIGAFSRHCLKDSLQIWVGPRQFEALRMQTQRARLILMCLQRAVANVLICQQSHPLEPRQHLLEEFELLPGLLRVKGGETRDVAAWPLQTRDQARLNGIDHYRHDDGNRGSRTLRSPNHHRTDSDDDVHPETNQFGSQGGELFDPPLRPSRLDDDVPAVYIAELAKALTKCLQREIRRRRRRGRVRPEIPDPRDLAGLLRRG